MKKLNQYGFTAIEGLLILVIVGIVGGVGWYVIDSKDKSYQTTNNSKQETVSNDSYNAPISSASDGGCATSKYDLFSKQTDPYRFKDKLDRFEFSYPKQWGKVLVHNDNPEIVCVGPFVISIGKAGKFGQGDGPLTSNIHGYFKKGSTYYTNWFKDSKEGPYKIFKGNYVTNKVVPTANSEALLNIDDCFEIGCDRVAMINLGGKKYTGIGISDGRLTKEDSASIKKERAKIGDTNKDPEIDSSIPLSDAVKEFETFLKTFKIL